MVAITVNTEVQATRFTIATVLGIELAELTAQLIDTDVGRAGVIILAFQVCIARTWHTWNRRVNAT